MATDINYKHLEPLDITLPSNLEYIKNWISIKKGKKECDKKQGGPSHRGVWGWRFSAP